MTSYWCELAWLGAERAEPGLLLEVEDGRIESMTRGVGTPPAEAERLAGLTLPGFANAHSHAFQRVLRGRTHGGQGSFWTWREQMYAAAARIEPEEYLELARATFAEMALAGITLVGEFHYLHRGPGGAAYIDANAMGSAVIEAAAQAGHPDHAARRLLPARRHRQAARRGPAALHRRRRGRLGRARRARWRRARGRASARRSTACARWTRTRRASWPPGPPSAALPLHAHVSEQPAENEECLAAYGGTPTAAPVGGRRAVASASPPSTPRT